MDREHLDGRGVGLQAAGAFLVALGLGGRDPLAQPHRQRGGAELLGRRRAVQQLPDVAQVGQPALAVDHPQHAPRQPLDERDRLRQRRQPAAAQDAAHACRRRWTSSHSSSPAAATCSAVQPRNDVIVAARARTGDAGRSSASSSRSHSRAAGVANTLPAPLMTAGCRRRRARRAPSTAWRLYARAPRRGAGDGAPHRGPDSTRTRSAARSRATNTRAEFRPA